MEEYIVKVYEDQTEWWQNNQLHRTNGPAIEYSNGTRSWYQNGQYHRIDGPAIEYPNGNKIWYKNDQLHRTDGPAVEYVSGYNEWWFEGKKYTEENFLKLTSPSPPKELIIEEYIAKVYSDEAEWLKFLNYLNEK
jgi:hypothetical protein